MWVRGWGTRQPAIPGLVLTWRQVPAKGNGSPAYRWQAQVLTVEERDESARVQWYYDTELTPAESPPPIA